MHERVLDERAADPQDAALVPEGRRAAVRLELERMAGGDGDRPELVGERLRQLAQVDALPLDVHAPGVEARQVEEILRQPLEPVDLLAHRLEELRACRLVEVLVGQQLEESAEREERRPQLVGGVADELPPRALELREPQAHPVEGAGELPELVGAAVDDRLVELPGGDPLRGGLEPPDAAREEKRGAVADAEREQQREDAGLDEPALHRADVRKRIAQRRREEDDVVEPDRLRDLGELRRRRA